MAENINGNFLKETDISLSLHMLPMGGLDSIDTLNHVQLEVKVSPILGKDLGLVVQVRFELSLSKFKNEFDLNELNLIKLKFELKF